MKRMLNLMWRTAVLATVLPAVAEEDGGLRESEVVKPSDLQDAVVVQPQVEEPGRAPLRRLAGEESAVELHPQPDRTLVRVERAGAPRRQRHQRGKARARHCPESHLVLSCP